MKNKYVYVVQERSMFSSNWSDVCCDTFYSTKDKAQEEVFRLTNIKPFNCYKVKRKIVPAG